MLHNRPAAEIQDLPDQAGSPLNLILNDDQAVAAAWRQIGITPQQVRVDDDRSHDVVEVMRNTGRQLPNSRQPLLHLDACLALSFSSDISQDNNPPAIWVAGLQRLDSQLVDQAGRAGDLQLAPDAVPILGYQGFQPATTQLEEITYRALDVQVRQISLRRRVRQDNLQLVVQQDDPFRHAFHDLFDLPRLIADFFQQFDALYCASQLPANRFDQRHFFCSPGARPGRGNAQPADPPPLCQDRNSKRSPDANLRKQRNHAG